MLTSRDAPAFDVRLDCFTGPFDLLLGLVARHRLDLTEVALAQVTDEFVAHLRRLVAAEEAGGEGGGSDALGQLSGFLLVAATLLDLKTARLLPAPPVEDAEDLALLEARDLLFARLLQQRAFSAVAAVLADRLAEQARWVARRPGDDDAPSPARAGPGAPAGPAEAVPAPLLVAPRELARLAAAALARRPARPLVARDHLHTPPTSIPEQVELLSARLAGSTPLAFSALVADAGTRAVVVGRFLALLELHRRGWVDLEQAGPAEPLWVSWRDVDVRDVAVRDVDVRDVAVVA